MASAGTLLYFTGLETFANMCACSLIFSSHEDSSAETCEKSDPQDDTQAAAPQQETSTLHPLPSRTSSPYKPAAEAQSQAAKATQRA